MLENQDGARSRCHNREVATIRERAEAAADARTPAQTLRDLATDANWRVRYAVAANPSTPTDLLVALSHDDQVVVRLGVADNPQPIAIKIALRSDDHETRKRVVHRRDLTPQVWQQLLDDPDHRVRAEIAMECPDPQFIARLVRDSHPEVRASAVHSRHLTSADAEQLAADRIATARAAAGTSGKLQPATLIRLARDRSVLVRWCVLINNPNRTDIATIIAAEDPDEMNAGQARAQLTLLRNL